MIPNKGNGRSSLKRILIKHKTLYLLLVPGILYFLIFHYIPMFGVVIAFQDYRLDKGIIGMFYDARWIGFDNFTRLFNSYYFLRILRNTIVMSLYKLLFGFPGPIILALLLNELRNRIFKRTVQTISYLPHFLSWMIVCGLAVAVLNPTSGLVNQVIKDLGRQPVFFLTRKEYFRSIIVFMNVWKGIGWGSIVYLAAISSINAEMYEHAVIEGAGKIKQIIYITLPSLSFIIVFFFIFSLGGILSAGFEDILLLYSPVVYEVADVIDTFIYREGLIGTNFSYGAAVGLWRNVIALMLILGSNYVVKKLGHHGIW